MNRKVLAILVPALLAADAANAAETYNKNGNKANSYGKMVGERIWSNTDNSNSENEDTSSVRIGIKDETHNNSELLRSGHWVNNLSPSQP